MIDAITVMICDAVAVSKHEFPGQVYHLYRVYQVYLVYLAKSLHFICKCCKQSRWQ